MKALLMLEDGLVFEGDAIGASGVSTGEVVFTTGMTGYQEMLTDPSFRGQILTLTYPLIGNYGVVELDEESERVQVAGFVVRELCDTPSNWRSTGDLGSYLKRTGVVGIQGIDTRALTRHLRNKGVMMGAISHEHTKDELRAILAEAPPYDSRDFVRECTIREPTIWTGGCGDDPVRAKWLTQAEETRYRVALLDLGVKRNILRSLNYVGCEVTVWPCTTPAQEILDSKPDGVFLSPGPGDPSRLAYLYDTVRQLAVSGTPVAGICLGHQLMAYAFGGHSYKLTFGHRGGNHPVKDLATGRVSITSQNHGYAVDPETIKDTGLEVSHINMNDNTVEGLRHKEYPVFTIQYHPEASPGPRDSSYLFAEFVKHIEANRPA